VCTRDLYLFKPLLAEAQTLSQRLDDALARIVALEAGAAATATLAALADPALADKKPGRSRAPRKPVMSLGRAVLALVVTLVCAHTLIVVALDLPVIWLRLICVTVPIPFGYLMAKARRKPLYPLALAVAGVALVVPLAMAAVVAAIDHTSVLPSDPRELQEFMSFALSIGLSLGTGMILARTLGLGDSHALDEASRTYGRIANLIHRLSPELVQKNFESTQKALLAFIAVCTTAASMVSGLKDVVGGRRVAADRPGVAAPALPALSPSPTGAPAVLLAPGALAPRAGASVTELHPLLGDPAPRAAKPGQ
jgi:hypothetical protein